ncbi:unnamed protein product [Diatraea saccharalis]|uniref:Uncharacterized protein n=1 Tax=Diatraea saccharalis TaxID=40085 RepID=A0A9N9RC09_9NEOP|nr:unnamed protein product [Diatraea saccharalis]
MISQKPEVSMNETKKVGDMKSKKRDNIDDHGGQNSKDLDDSHLVSQDQQQGTSVSSLMSSSYETMLNVDREEAKQSIINTINSYEDNRFPSQGVNYSDMTSNARIEQSVASEILNRTLEYEEREYFRQFDAMTSQAGNIDNKTNAIIERLSDSLENEYTLPEVSRILEAHMETAEQMWRAGDLTRYVSISPTGSVHEHDDAESTLVPSTDVSFEDTLIEDNVNTTALTEIDDSGIGVSLNDDETEINDNPIGIIYHTDAEGGMEKNCNASCSPTNNENNPLDDNNDSKLDDYVSVVGDCELANEVFEDCEDLLEKAENVCDVDADTAVGADFDRSNENFSLEMKLALEIDRNVTD